jgi:hypothetical protein
MKLFQKQIKTCTQCPNLSTDGTGFLNQGTKYLCGKTRTHLCWFGDEIEDAIPIPKNCPLPNIEEVIS